MTSKDLIPDYTQTQPPFQSELHTKVNPRHRIAVHIQSTGLLWQGIGASIPRAKQPKERGSIHNQAGVVQSLETRARS